MWSRPEEVKRGVQVFGKGGKKPLRRGLETREGRRDSRPPGERQLDKVSHRDTPQSVKSKRAEYFKLLASDHVTMS